MLKRCVSGGSFLGKPDGKKVRRGRGPGKGHGNKQMEKGRPWIRDEWRRQVLKGGPTDSSDDQEEVQNINREKIPRKHIF